MHTLINLINMDKDLEFLRKCDNDDLQVLCDYLTEKGSLSESLKNKDSYKKYYPNNLIAMVDDIECEFREFGSNTFFNFFGITNSYKKILCKVCDKMKVNYNKKQEVCFIEQNLLLKVLTDSVEKMSQEQIENIVKDMHLNVNIPTKEAVVAALQAGVKLGGFAVYQGALIVANGFANAVLGKGLTFVANKTLTKVIGAFAGPIGWAITAIWAAIDIAGPAYRVIIPACIQIAYMRTKLNSTLG